MKYVLIFSLLAFSALHTQANLLINPSFENGLNNWTVFGNVSHEEWADQNGANLSDIGLDVPNDFGLAMQGWINGGNGGFYQDVAGANPGNPYTFSGYFHFEPGFDPTTLELKIEWYDAGFAKTGPDNINNLIPVTTGDNATNPAQWQFFEITGIAPVNTVTVRPVVFFAGTTDNGGNQAGRFDNASLTTVPEPGTVGLLGLFLGGFAWMNARRRRA